MESNEPVHHEKFLRILTEMREARLQKRIKYHLGYSNFTFELWMILHKQKSIGSLDHRSQYLEPINRCFGENFENLDQYKHEKNFKRCLSKLSLDDVKHAVQNAAVLTANNAQIGKIQVRHKGFSYFRDNPALSIHEAIARMFIESGI